MFASRTIDMPRRQLLAKLENENCAIEGEANSHFIALVPGWDANVSVIFEKWPFLKIFWDKVVIIPEGPHGPEGAQRHKVQLVYWTPTRLALHFIFSTLALLELLEKTVTMGQAQMVLFVVFVNMLIPIAAHIEIHSLFDRLDNNK